jgi:hypothetical protein
MIDSGATQSFIHKSLVDKYDIPVMQLPQPIALDVADGRPIKSGAITHKTCSVSVRVENHHEKIDFYVTNIGQHSIILGTSWLKKHNPRINWSNRQVDFSSDFCRTSCLRKQEVSSRTPKSRQSATSIKPDWTGNLRSRIIKNTLLSSTNPCRPQSLPLRRSA